MAILDAKRFSELAIEGFDDVGECVHAISLH
jgi:hypothetical protein